MKTFDATPQADYPEQVIVAGDTEFTARHPEAAYRLRVKLPDNGVAVHQLPGAVGPTHARQMARAMGFEPTHWTNLGDSRPHLF
jgi:hypothetical protein